MNKWSQKPLKTGRNRKARRVGKINLYFMENLRITVYANNYTSNFQKIIKTNIVSKLLLFVILFVSLQGKLLAQISTSKVPIGAIEINIKTQDQDQIVYITGQVHLTMKTDTSKTYNNDSFKSLTFDINDGLSICPKDEALFNTVFSHHYGTELICIEETKNYYRVLVNKSGLSYWIARSEFLKFIRIEEYLSEIFIVKGQNIYSSPNINSPKIPIRIDESLNCKVIQVKGDWILVKQSESDEGTVPNVKFKTGWVKWFSGNMITVGLIDSN
jgi:hypothetical protein